MQRHGPTVLRVCRAVLGPVDADDAWSETFVSALRAYPDLPDTANLEAWLVTIAHRRAIDVTRAAGRRPTPHERLPDQHDPRAAAVTPAPIGVPGADDADDELYAALADLPTKQRLAVAYHHLAGLPHADVAALLDQSPAAARRASADGIAALRRRMTRTSTGDPR